MVLVCVIITHHSMLWIMIVVEYVFVRNTCSHTWEGC